jgi:nucleotide-binding universal stress UspA family protein
LWGALLARDLNEQPTVLRAIRHSSLRAAAGQVLSDAVAFLRQYVPAVETRIRVGHPAEEIVKEAEEGTYDLLVIGERQFQSLQTRFLLGATTERVVEHAPCPVVVAKGRIAPVRRILLCEGIRDDETLVKRFVQRLSPLLTLNPTITILHVMSQISVAPSKSGDVLLATAEQLIERSTSEGRRLFRDKALLEREGISPSLKVRHGLVVDEIIAEARTGIYDLLVIGAHQDQGWQHILLDDLSRQVLAGAELPVLVIR